MIQGFYNCKFYARSKKWEIKTGSRMGNLEVGSRE